MSDETINPFTTNDTGSRSLLHIPETPDEFLSPRPSSLIAEAETAMRHPEHWAQMCPYFKAIAGVGATINGSPKWDHAGLVFKFQEICGQNGYHLLAKASPAELSPVIARAYKRVAGQTFKALTQQRRQLRIEHKTRD